MAIRPLQDRVIVKRVDEKEKTKGGIIIPDTAKEKPIEGEVLAVGPGERDDSGKLAPLSVKKGDRVRIAVTNIKGMHDFVIDEFGVKQETPLTEKTVIEFVADKAGTFEYYCSKPGHRAKGQWGKLIVE